MPTPHPAKLQSVLLLGAIAVAYIVLHIPALSGYSLQVFAGSLVLFFILKRIKRAKLWHILPDKMSLEIGLLTFAFTYLIGATGNTHSIFYPLSYIHLFLLIFSSTPLTSVSTIIFLMLFHYSLEPNLSIEEVGSVLSLPVIGMILLFAKKQYDEVHVKEVELEKELVKLDKTSQKERSLEGFLAGFLSPKLHMLQQLLKDPDTTKDTVLKQLSLLESEVEKLTTTVSNTEEDTAQAAPTDKIQEY